MPDNKKPPEPEVQTDQSGNQKGSPPNQIDNVTYKVVGEESQISPPIFHPPKIIVPAGYKPFKSRTQQLPSGKDILIRLPDGRFVNQYEAERFYGTIPKDAIIIERTTELPDNENTVEAIRQPDGSYKVPNIDTSLQPQQKKESRLTTAQAPQIAQKTHTRVIPEVQTPEQSAWEEVDEKRRRELEELETTVKELSGGKEYEENQKIVEDLKRTALWETKEKKGEVDAKNLPTIKKMVGEFKDFYFRGYSDAIKQAASSAPLNAANIEQHQIYALRQGMSSLTNLHYGLDEASWNFFFALLGPIGDELAHLKHQKISLTMKYQRSVLSPFYIDYLMKTLPEEKAFDLIYDNMKKVIYYVGKVIDPFHVVTKITYDQYGRKLKHPEYTLTPLIKFQQGANTISNIFGRLTTENSLYIAQQKLQNASWLNSKNKLSDLDLYNERVNFMKTKAEINKHFFINPIIALEKTERGRKAREIFIARIARTLGLGSLRKNANRTDRDVLTYFAFLIGGWIFDVTIGNLTRIIAEKITSTMAWQKMSLALEKIAQHPFMQGIKASGIVTQEFLGAGPSLNTLSGGYLGYNVGGVIGQNIAQALGVDPTVGFQIGSTIGLPVGGGLGWGYQWALNLTKNNFLMGRASSLYTKLPAQIQRLEGLRWQAYKKFRAGSSQVARIDSAINDLKAQQSSLMTRLMGPGPMLRFANWLRVNPLGRLFRIPLKGFAASSLIDQLHALDMPLPDWYQGWMPPMAQYLWEIKGVLFEMGVDHVFMPAWKSLAFNANTVEVFKFTQEEWISERAFMNRLVGPGYENYNIIRTRFLPDGMVNVEIGEFKPFFKNISNVFSNANQWLRNFKAWDIKLSRTAPATWVRNVLNPGLIMGWEIGVMMGLPWYGIIATSLGGSMLYGLGSWGAWRLASALNLITEGFGSFFGRINTFGMVGWGVGIVADIAGLHTVSFLGYTLSSQLFFTGLGVGVGLAWPSIVAFANGVALTSWGAAIGSSLGGTFASLGITAATTAVLSTIIAVGSVALLTIFIVFVVGSAFWVPLQEITEGVGVESACFRVTPDTQNLILKNGEDKQICAIIDNKNQQYPGKDIYTSFYFNPPDNFQWTNGQYTIMDMAGVPISLPSKSVPLYETGAGRVIGAQITMELPPTPPDQTKQQLANQVAEIQNKSASLQAQGFTKDQASTILLAQQYINGDFYAHQVDVYKQQLAALNTIQQQKATKDFTEYKNNIKNILNPNKVKTDIITQLNYDSAAVIQSDPRAIYLAGLVNTCQKNPTAKDCEELNKEIDQLITNAQTQSDQFFNQVENYTKNGGAVPLDFLSDTKNQLDTVIKQGDFVKGEYETQGQLAFDASQVKQGNSVDNILNNSKYNTQSFTLNSQQFRACINVKYVGKDNEEASVSVKNQASAPMLLFGALGALTPLCSAQSQINFNTAPQKPGSLSDPIKGPQCSTQTFDPKTHTGVDITNASNEASSCGESIYPAKEGTIVSEGFDNTNPQKTNKGNYVIIDHGSGLYSLYAHMGNSINYQFPKQIGDSVGINDIIGQVGSTGNSTGCHLHLGVVSGEQQGLTGTPLLPRFNSSTTVDPCLYFSCPTSCQTP